MRPPFRKNSSSVSFFRSRPNHSGSLLSRLLTTVTNFCGLPQEDLVDCHVTPGGLPALLMPAFQIAKIDGSDGTLGHAKLRGYTPRRSLLDNCSSFSIFKPQMGQRTRYGSITTV